MSNQFALVEPDAPLFRLGRHPNAWAWPDWAYAGADATFGNRYDDPDASYRVLYASAKRRGAFVETLARFRPDLEVLAELERIDGDEEPSAALPRTWEQGRAIGQAMLRGTFADVGDAVSLATLRGALAADALRYGLDEIDAATTRLRAPRAFTQLVSRFIYEQRHDQGPFAGIRYRSRLGDEIANWAVFEPAPGLPSPFRAATSRAIHIDDPDLVAALGLLDLSLV